jgi:hypothetical protein
MKGYIDRRGPEWPGYVRQDFKIGAEARGIYSDLSL